MENLDAESQKIVKGKLAEGYDVAHLGAGDPREPVVNGLGTYGEMTKVSVKEIAAGFAFLIDKTLEYKSKLGISDGELAVQRLLREYPDFKKFWDAFAMVVVIIMQAYPERAKMELLRDDTMKMVAVRHSGGDYTAMCESHRTVTKMDSAPSK